MPITNLAIQRRRLHELYQLIYERELEILSVELSTAAHYYDQRTYGYEFFVIHARKLTPQNVKKIQDAGFKVERVKATNEHSLTIDVYKSPTEEEKPTKVNKK